jgi:UDP-2,3-diacylglucosamine hydrolase
VSGGDLIFVGDAHLESDDPALGDFLDFLRRLPGEARRVVFLGDLFQLWLGRRDLEGPHHREVLAVLRSLRSHGVTVRYVEGNRDFHLGPAYAGDALDEAADGGIVERFAGRSLFAVHGDLANPHDLQYRTWRRVARSRLLWAAFGALPARRRAALAEAAERGMRTSNLRFKGAFPEAAVRAYAAPFLDQGHDAVVLGHFHVERDLTVPGPGGQRRILVLPEWRASRRHLRVTAAGDMCFEG